MTKLRVLVADDSLTVRKHIVETLSADPAIEVVGEAEDGRQAIELCLKLRPDVITMDMMMPVMTGLAATEYIMAHCPTPILVVSASINRGELFKTYDALAAGAVDVIDKSAAADSGGVWERNLVAATKLVAKIRVITHPRGRLMSLDRPRAAPPPPAAAGRRQPRREVVAIGASTGGPAAIVEVLRGLPPTFRLPVLFVLHINEPFGKAFADWLDGQTARRVAFAKDGDSVASAAGRVVMAPPGRHLVVRDRRLRLTDAPERHSCRPSIDVLFESVAHEFGPGAAAGLLTGMGRDGASGLLEIRRAGGLTIAQDEATSVIYGMPREALLLGAAERILPLGEIGPELAADASEAGS
jgi:two-component system chemotaxis response regulator CheB